MTQVVILLGVFLLALMLHYFVVMEGFQDKAAAPSGQTPFSELIDKLTFFSTKEIQYPPVPTVVNKAAPTTESTTATPTPTPTKDSTVKAAEPTDTKKEDKSAPAGSIASKKEVAVGPKDNANASIAERSQKPVVPDSVSSKVTSALQQGKEFLQSGCKPKPRPPFPPAPNPGPNPGPTPGPTPDPAPCPTPVCPTPKPVPFPCNSSDYIRKDQIPCWGCTLK